MVTAVPGALSCRVEYSRSPGELAVTAGVVISVSSIDTSPCSFNVPVLTSSRAEGASVGVGLVT